MLQVQGLSKHFGDVRALDDATFEVPPGRIVGFLGPNGAGKTTTMRCIFGLVRPDAGSIRWDGQAVDQTVRLRFGYMPEERGLYPKMRVQDQVEYFARMSGLARAEARDAAAEWLDRLDLADRAQSRLEELSHGNQQRVQLAVAFAHGPDLAVLDEPFAGLDPLGVEVLAERLRELAVSGTSILFSSHQLDLVEDICEDVIIVHRGRIVLSGEVERLRTESPVRHVAIEVDGDPWDGAGDGYRRIIRNGKGGYEVPAEEPIEGLLELARADGEITRLVFEPPNLSDLFRQAVTS
jgi:ABC-2 type transport system ATP-binding protein